jgi:hypothetical protein
MSPGRPSLRSRLAGLEDRVVNYAPAPGAGPGVTLEVRTPDVFAGAVRRAMAVFRDTPANDRRRGRVVAARAAVRDLSVVSLVPRFPVHPPVPPPGPRWPTIQCPRHVRTPCRRRPRRHNCVDGGGSGSCIGEARRDAPHRSSRRRSRVPPKPVPIAPRARVGPLPPPTRSGGAARNCFAHWRLGFGQ